MKAIRHLVIILIAPYCLAGDFDIYEKIATLTEKEGAFEVCDIQALSDGGTTSICLFADPGKLWMTKRNDKKSTWIVVYEDEKKTR